MRLTNIVLAFVATASSTYAATTTSDSDSSSTSTATAVQSPSAAPTLGSPISQGCFSSWGNMILNSTVKFNSMGGCITDLCTPAGYTVGAMTGGNECYCGTEYPPKDTLVDDSKCNVGCPGYGLEACGGIGTYSVFNTGIMLEVDYAEANTTSSASGTSGTVVASSTVVSGGQTSVVYVTQSPTSSTDSTKSSSANVGGIVAGVVVGVVVLLAIAGGFIFWHRRRRNQEIEEEHRRNAAVNAFMKPPGSSGGYSVENDSRMDPVMAQRRLSSGSIADNEDYSRRILRVTNA